jgi:hypothetical protein
VTPSRKVSSCSTAELHQSKLEEKWSDSLDFNLDDAGFAERRSQNKKPGPPQGDRAEPGRTTLALDLLMILAWALERAAHTTVIQLGLYEVFKLSGKTREQLSCHSALNSGFCGRFSSTRLVLNRN